MISPGALGTLEADIRAMFWLASSLALPWLSCMALCQQPRILWPREPTERRLRDLVDGRLESPTLVPKPVGDFEKPDGLPRVEERVFRDTGIVHG